MMSQQLVMSTHQHHVLSGLTLEEVSALLAHEGVATLAANEQAQLYAMTRGNPALIKLFIVLQRAGERPSDVLAQLAGGPSAEVLLNRIWKRLEMDERALLMALSVFRGSSPQDAWSDYGNALDRLITRDLIESDGKGGIILPAYIREFLLRRITADQRTALHLAAGEIRETRGEYTSAAYHYVVGRQPALAIWTWFDHRELETERGHAPAAREIFRGVAPSELSDDDDRRALAILQTEQLLLTGSADEANEAIHSVSWPLVHPATPHARQLEGDILQIQGQIEQALEKYRGALNTLSDPRDRRMVRLRTKIGYVYVSRLRDLEQAHRESTLALWQAHTFRGLVEEEAGNYAAARTHYESALAITADLQSNSAVQSETHSHLGHLCMRQGDAEGAIKHLEISMRQAEKAGEPVNATYDQLNLASSYVIAGRYLDALNQAQTGLRVAASMQHSFLIAGLTACAAEACFYLNRLDEAEQYALRSLHEEEEVHRPYAITVLGGVQHARGQLDQAEKTLLNAIQSAQDTQDKYAEAPAWKSLGALYRDQGRRAEASDAYARAQQLFEALNLTAEAEVIAAARATLAFTG
jgi:tetratricopeptide (TPR) repeat protein